MRVASKTQRGAVTAELAMGLPLLVAVTLGLAWLLTVGLAQVRMIDAARETARAVARGDSTDSALGVGSRVAPPGAKITVTVTDATVVVTASDHVDGPVGPFDFFPGIEVRASATALMEQS
jgi:Flp pilus assembly protein TadG